MIWITKSVLMEMQFTKYFGNVMHCTSWIGKANQTKGS